MVSRINEMKILQSVYESTGNQIVLISGNHRSEKERMIFSFCRDKKYFYYRGRNASAEEQLTQMQTEVENIYDVKLMKNNYDECFTRIKSGDASKLVVIIDEFQAIVKKDKSFFDSIIKLKNKKLYPGPVMIVLMSSSLSWSRQNLDDVLGVNASSIDHMVELKEFSFLDVVRSFPNYSVAEAVSVYGIIGGCSYYLNRWNGNKTMKENICTMILNPYGSLFGEAENFISQELRELSVYDTILYAMAMGNEKLNDLYQFTGYSRAKISVYLKNLAAFDVIEKVVSFETGGWDNTKKGVYRIKNPFIHFWFRFVYENQSDLWKMSPEEFYDTYISDKLNEYLTPYFVKVCSEYLGLLNMVGKTPIKMNHMGTWIGKEGTIDIVGQDAKRDCVVGICNWDKETLSFDDYQELLN
ncbi:MAG: ATP-binding protein, partial [Lachnospiraceae bacterium]|nr:ATP-binding protein [Lachnospiraceae bacterium]